MNSIQSFRESGSLFQACLHISQRHLPPRPFLRTHAIKAPCPLTASWTAFAHSTNRNHGSAPTRPRYSKHTSRYPSAILPSNLAFARTPVSKVRYPSPSLLFSDPAFLLPSTPSIGNKPPFPLIPAPPIQGAQSSSPVYNPAPSIKPRPHSMKSRPHTKKRRASHIEKHTHPQLRTTCHHEWNAASKSSSR